MGDEGRSHKGSRVTVDEGRGREGSRVTGDGGREGSGVAGDED